jgi:hypothetical protein
MDAPKTTPDELQGGTAADVGAAGSVLTRYEPGRIDPQPESARSRGVTTMPANGMRLELRSRSPEASLAGA